MDGPILVLDFDGTLCMGDDPVWAYADAVAQHLDISAAALLDDGLEAFLAGAASTQGGTADYVDGYAAVQALTHGLVDQSALSAAYLASRTQLAEGEVAVWAPPGCADFLTNCHARRVLVTNSPPIGIDETLAVLGLTDVIDEVITNADKPHGMPAIIDSLLGDGPPERLMSVGDIWRNDLEYPHTRGCGTAYIDRFGRSAHPATFSASKFEDLYDSILGWVQASTHSPVHN